MIYPRHIKKNDTIGIVPIIGGITNELKIKRLENAKRMLKEYGFNTIETKSTRQSINGKSNEEKIISKELEELYNNKDISLIISATGGDFLVELLPYINYNTIKKNIKWIQGYSDPTALLFTITTNLDIATIYSYNIGTYGMNKWHKSIYDNINLLEGKINTQNNYEYYENSYTQMITGLEEFSEDKKVEWKSLDNKNITMKGRIIGGCLDVLLSLIGTKYDKTKQFIDKYKEDGIIWYFDNCELSIEGIIRAMWQFKNAGYFKHTKGIIFGRSMNEYSNYDITLKEALIHSFKDLNIPIIYDVDIGHKHPIVTIINGSIATISLINSKGSIKQELL